MSVYLDNNATTRPAPEVIDAVVAALGNDWANPSSVHRSGQAARHVVELARASVAGLVGATQREIVFTSGAAEAIGLAIRGVLGAAAPSRRTIITTPIEHESVRDLLASLSDEPPDGATALTVRHLAVGADGVVDARSLEPLLDDSVALVCCMWANNETGAVQPVEAIGALCRARRVPLFCDATQWVGKMPTDLAKMSIDLACLSAHKLHGPKGVGALYVRRGVALRPVQAGVQELGRRGGTENVPGIAGLGVAARLAREWLARPDERARLGALRDRLERELVARVPDAVVIGPADDAGGPSHDPSRRLWNTLSIAFPGLEAEAVLLLLSEQGVSASAGAACSSGSLDPSPVLLAMGLPRHVAHGAIRLSLSRLTTAREIDQALEIIPACVARLRSSGDSLGGMGALGGPAQGPVARGRPGPPLSS